MHAVAERRLVERQPTELMRRELTPEQVGMLYTLERFGWGLKFVRKSETHKVVVLFDPDSRRYAVLRSDGELDEKPEGLRIRDAQGNATDYTGAPLLA
ncbi:hypothetical protein [Luteimonas vadosa]|uniref:Uncharacterized protein n=1 Tax=Luteimonas vadosa TaxID=1165507 RepID=A0ABP9E8N9_9GAMM